MSDPHQSNARRIPASEFRDSIHNAKKAQNIAQRLIENAKREAQVIVETAEGRAAALHRDLEELTNKELRSFIDEDRLKRHAKAFIKALTEINNIRKSHAALTPWIIDLVETCLYRIIGEIDLAETTACIVRQGIRELQDSHNVKLWVHPDNLENAKRAQTAHPDFFTAVTDIATDTELPKDILKLTCSIGSVDLSVDASLARIVELMKASNALNVSPKVKM